MKLLLVDVDGVLIPENNNILNQEAVLLLDKFIESNNLFPVWCTGRNFPNDMFYEQILKIIPKSIKWPIISLSNYIHSGWWKSFDVQQYINTMVNIEQIWIVDDDCLKTEEKALSELFQKPVKVITPNRLKGLTIEDIN